jgi:phosphohistidine phosphatase SixA
MFTRRSCLLLAACIGCERNLEATVFVVRHAEPHRTIGKRDERDPDLSDAGRRRAHSLCQQLHDEDVQTIIASPYKRTQQTAEPLATALRLKVNIMPAGDTDGIARRLRSLARGAALVAGHSNTVPEIIAALGVFEPISLGHQDYGDLFAVRPSGQAIVLERLRF